MTFNDNNKPNHLSFLFLFCLLLFSSLPFPTLSNVAATPAAPLATQIHALQQEMLPHAHVGLVVLDPKTGETLFEQNGEDYFYPASNTKLFTAAAALKYLGADYRFKTALYYNRNHITKPTLNGDISIAFEGDPSLGIQELRLILSQLSDEGITAIKGNVVIDNTRFAKPDYAPGWTIDSMHWYHSTPVSSLLINQNHVKFAIQPSNTLGGKVQFKQLSDDLPPIPITHNVTTVSENEANSHCSIILNVQNNNIDLKGCWPITGGPNTIKIALDNPEKWAKDIIHTILKEQNITLNGQIVFNQKNKTKTTTPTQHPQATYQSAPLKTLLETLLKDSNNLYAESITKTLGAIKHEQGSFQLGTLAIQEILKEKANLEFAHLQLRDGSGASRYNLITPHQVAHLLFAMYHDNKNREDFINALPTTKIGNNLYQAKTGTATGTSALSGYLTTKDKTLIISLLINQTHEQHQQLKTFEQAVFLALNQTI